VLGDQHPSSVYRIYRTVKGLDGLSDLCDNSGRGAFAAGGQWMTTQKQPATPGAEPHLTKKQNDKVKASIDRFKLALQKKHDKTIEALQDSYHRAVSQGIWQNYAKLKETVKVGFEAELERAQRILDLHTNALNREEWNQLSMVLHPDTSDNYGKAERAECFRILLAKRDVLTIPQKKGKK
jgi:hypothetical protein